MKNDHINLRELGIAVLAPVCMVLVQDCISAAAQLLYKDNRDTGIPVSLLSYTAIIFIAAYLYFGKGEKKHAEKKQAPALRVFLIFILLFIAGISLQFFSTGILNIIDMYRPELLSSYKAMVKSSFSLDNGILRVFTVMLIAPVGEELVFRGLSLGSFQRAFSFKYSNAAAIFASALLFGLFHGNLVQFCYALPAGILLALLTTWTSALLPSVFLHMIINISSYAINLSGFTSLSPAAIISLTIASGVICAVIFLLLYRMLKLPPYRES